MSSAVARHDLAAVGWPGRSEEAGWGPNEEETVRAVRYGAAGDFSRKATRPWASRHLYEDAAGAGLCDRGRQASGTVGARVVAVALTNQGAGREVSWVARGERESDLVQAAR